MSVRTNTKFKDSNVKNGELAGNRATSVCLNTADHRWSPIKDCRSHLNYCRSSGKGCRRPQINGN